MLEMALVVNIQREHLNAIEVALSYKRLMEECKLTQEKMSQRVGKKRSSISNYLRLLKLPAKIQIGLKEEKISMGHARALINVENKETQLNIFHDTVANGFSVRDVEQIVKEFEKWLQKNRYEKNKKLSSFAHQKIANDLSHSLGKEVKLQVANSGKGKIEILLNQKKNFIQLLGILKNR